MSQWLHAYACNNWDATMLLAYFGLWARESPGL